MTFSTDRRPTPFGLFVVLSAVLCRHVSAEIRDFSLLLMPTSNSIHSAEGFLITPGSVDLRHLYFRVVGEKIDTGMIDDDDGDSEFITEIDDEGKNVGDGGGRRYLGDDLSNNSGSSAGSAIDVAILHKPQSCDRTRAGCDWPDLGIGKRSAEHDAIRYCCNNDAIEMGLCEGRQYGRLIMDSEKFRGEHRYFNIPAHGDYGNSMKSGLFKQNNENGKYAVVMSNCNDEGRPVMITGTTVWKSKHGYLPGDLFGLMYFFAVVTGLYFVLMLWYGISMRINENENIPIQNWIVVTIAMGTMELFFRSGDLFVWNVDGVRFTFAFYVGVVMGVIKRGVSRGLVVMLSLGWGVITDDLGDKMRKIIFLVAFYIILSLIRDGLSIFGAVEIHKISDEEEDEILDVVDILTVVISFVEILFYLWIIDSLNATMEYLETMSQSLKLLRYLRLRMILLVSILLAIMWAVFAIVDSKDEGIASQESKWVLDASMEVNYLFVLTGVAILWRPSPDAKSYAFVMELPSTSTDEDDEGGIEFAAVPSAKDDSDEDDNEHVASVGEEDADEHPSSYKDNAVMA